MRKLLERRLKEGGTYFKVKRVKVSNFVIVSFEITINN